LNEEDQVFVLVKKKRMKLLSIK